MEFYRAWLEGTSYERKDKWELDISEKKVLTDRVLSPNFRRGAKGRGTFKPKSGLNGPPAFSRQLPIRVWVDYFGRVLIAGRK